MYLDQVMHTNNLQQKNAQLAHTYKEEVEKVRKLQEDLSLLHEQVKQQKQDLDDRFASFVHITNNYMQLQNSTRNMRRQIYHFTHLPLRYQSRKRIRQSVDLLRGKSGASKRRLRIAR